MRARGTNWWDEPRSVDSAAHQHDRKGPLTSSARSEGPSSGGAAGSVWSSEEAFPKRRRVHVPDYVTLGCPVTSRQVRAVQDDASGGQREQRHQRPQVAPLPRTRQRQHRRPRAPRVYILRLGDPDPARGPGPGTRREPFNSNPTGVNSVLSAHLLIHGWASLSSARLHARPVGVHRACK